MKKAGVKVLQGNEWQIEEDLVLKEEKIYTEEQRAQSRDNLVAS